MDETSGNLGWLLQGDPMLNAIVRKELLGDRSNIDRISNDQRVRAMIDEVTTWPWPPLVSHKSAGHPIHRLAFLADLRIDIEGLVGDDLLRKIMMTADDGVPRVHATIPVRYGGSGGTELGWALCDAPLMLYSLARCFPSFDGRDGIRALASHSIGEGMPCKVSPEFGKFRGPGRKDDPCPLATLYTLKAIMHVDPKGSKDLAMVCSEALLSLWENSRRRHPYMFFMGTDFRKLKLPMVWYDILSVADTLSDCPWIRDDLRFLDMLAVIGSKKDADGRYTPESVWTAWKDWDFCQKKTPSRWMTFCVERIQRKAGKVLSSSEQRI